PLPPPWLAVDGRKAATAAVRPIKLPNSCLYFTCMGLSTAKPPPWWRSDDGTATIAAPCGVGLVVQPLPTPPSPYATDPPSPHPTVHVTAATTAATAAAFPAAAAAVAGCGRQKGRHRRGGAYKTSKFLFKFSMHGGYIDLFTKYLISGRLV
nr:hypothetical protein [Tanacetum cinerariifolium]